MSAVHPSAPKGATRARTLARYVVVVGLELSVAGEAAVEFAVRNAVVDPAWNVHFVHVEPEVVSEEQARDELAHARAARHAVALRERLLALEGTPFEHRVQYHRLTSPRPARALLRFAADVDADLVVVGDDALADQVAPAAECSVVIAR